MSMLKVRVAEILEETSCVKSFRLQRADGTPFDPYPAGAHIDIVGPTGIIRQYSLCSPPENTEDYVVAVKLERDSRGGSAALHDQVETGQQLEISAPRNLLAVATNADRHILVAAGIGVTPMMSIAHHLNSTGQDFELHYFARSRDAAAFCDMLVTTTGFGDRVHFHFGLQRSDMPSALDGAFGGLTSSSHVYTCGPEGFMDLVQKYASSVIPADNVHTEHFHATAPVDDASDTPFEIELDGGIYEVPPGKSIVQVLTENDIEVDTSCQEGICGTCIMGVLSGVPDHRDQCMSSSEKKANEQIAACVSRSKSARLVLEIF